MLKRLYLQMGTFVFSPYAPAILALLFFIEAIFFVPVDPLLILYCTENQPRSLFYAAIATCASVLGGIAGYIIGMFLWNIVGLQLIHTFSSMHTFTTIVAYYQQYESMTVLIAAFTPIPYKVVTLTAGFCKLPLLPFIVCSIIGRGARFFLIGIVAYRYGNRMKQYIDQYFNSLVVLFTLLILGTLFLLK